MALSVTTDGLGVVGAVLQPLVARRRVESADQSIDDGGDGEVLPRTFESGQRRNVRPATDETAPGNTHSDIFHNMILSSRLLLALVR